MKKLLALVLTSFLCACVSTPAQISGTVPGEVVKVTNSTVVTDLQSAAYNFDNAVAVGALDANDPAPACLHAILVKAGIEVPTGATPAATFKPKNDGVASAGAIAYILAQQAQAIAASGALKSDPACEAVIGRIVVAGMKQLNNSLPLIPGVPRIP